MSSGLNMWMIFSGDTCVAKDSHTSQHRGPPRSACDYGDARFGQARFRLTIEPPTPDRPLIRKAVQIPEPHPAC